MFFTSEGSRLFYRTVGEGPALVLLHPTPVDHTFWIPIAESLSNRYRVILPDLRGHGLSEAGEGIISLERLGADIVSLLDAAATPEAFFAGCSIGSYALYEMWRRVPERIRALAFCCGKPQSDSESNRAKRALDIEKIRLAGTSQFFDRLTEVLVGPTCQKLHPAKSAELRRMMSPMPAEAVIAAQQGLAQRPDSLATLPTISVPVFALAGGEDPASTPAEMAAIANLTPQTVYHLLDDAGHYAPYEQPEVVGQLLVRFFDRCL